LRERGVAIECELLGRGALEDDLKRLASDLRLSADGAVRFSGWSADVEAALNRWDIFVFSVTDREGFGNAAAEAMAHGLPCILTDVGPCREVGGDAAAYVPPGNPQALADRIAGLAADVAQRRRLGSAAHEHAAKHFRAERKLGEFLSIGAGS
jgi:glycosyltransferase involved in cell wall biosynthesis